MNFRINTDRGRKGKIVAFNEVLNDIIQELDIQDELLILTLKENWEKIAGRILSVHSSPDRIFKKMLFIAVDHSIYANELIMMKNTILQKIDDIIGINIITTIKIETKRLGGKTNVSAFRRK